MVKAPKGLRHRTRKLMKKSVRERGAVPPLSRLLYEYEVGDRVHIVINPSTHDGMPHRRYHGRTGVVLGRRGDAYEIEVSLGGKKKILFIRPEHLQPTPEIIDREISKVRKLVEELRVRRREASKALSF
ncbi:MAG: 50S ribosomal protein L21e [Sulfolobales archaeon]